MVKPLKGKTAMSEFKQIGKFLARIAENLPEMSTDVRQGWIDNPRALKKYLLGLSPPEDIVAPTFKVWRTIMHRGCRNAESYRAGLLSTHCKISDWANDLLGRFETSSVDEEVDLGCASVAELGFTKAPRFDAICDMIVAMGNELCLPEDGPVLREQYLEQPMSEWVRLAMKAFRDAHRSLSIFYVGRDGHGLWLRRHYGNPDGLFYPEDRFVFRLSKRPLVA